MQGMTIWECNETKKSSLGVGSNEDVRWDVTLNVVVN